MQALGVGMTRPVMPKKRPVLTAVVCGIICIGHRDAARVAVDDHLAGVGNGAGAARAGTVGDAGAAALDDRIVDEACLLEGELGRASRKERNAAHQADALARDSVRAA